MRPTSDRVREWEAKRWNGAASDFAPERYSDIDRWVAEEKRQIHRDTIWIVSLWVAWYVATTVALLIAGGMI